jgi:hypothetical protein
MHGSSQNKLAFDGGRSAASFYRSIEVMGDKGVGPSPSRAKEQGNDGASTKIFGSSSSTAHPRRPIVVQQLEPLSIGWPLPPWSLASTVDFQSYYRRKVCLNLHAIDLCWRPFVSD